jgi:signal peptidase II
MAMQKHTLVRLAIICLLLLVCVGCDQAAKAIAKQTLAFSPPVSFLQGIVQFQYAENPGAFLSLGATLPAATRFLWGVVFIGLTQAALLVYLFRSASLTLYQKVGLSLFLGGGLGNLIDRIANDGHVIDFVSLGVGPLRTGIFNVADVAITMGVLLVVFSRGEELAPSAPSSTGSEQDPSQLPM